MNTAKESMVRMLIKGKTLKEISEILKEKNIKPNSLSFLEKLLKNLKVEHNAKTMLHLGVILATKANKDKALQN